MITLKKKFGGFGKFAKKLGCAGLCLAIAAGVIGVWNVPTEAAEETSASALGRGEEKSDFYLLSVSTGAAAGNCVQYFSIRYKDNEGAERTRLIFPHNYDLQDGIACASKISVSDDSETVYKLTGYSSTINPMGTYRDSLQANSTDQYLFRDYFGIKELIGFDIYMEYEDPKNTGYKNEWTCNGISLYKVDRLYGARRVALGDFSVDFDGMLLGYFHKKQENAGDFSLEGTSDVFRVRKGTSDPYEIVTTGFSANYRCENNLKDLIFRVDFADELGAGIEALAIAPSDRDSKGNTTIMGYNWNFGFARTGMQEALTIHVRYKDPYGIEREVFLPVYNMFVKFLYSQDRDTFGNVDINGFAQQGDTVAFYATLPDFDSLVSYSLIYGKEAAEAAKINGDTIFRPDKMPSEFRDTISRHKAFLDAGESMAYTGVSIYDASVSRATASMDGIMVRCSVEGTPLYYYKAKSTSGQVQSVGTERSVTMTKVNPDSSTSFSLLPKESKSAYIVEITTDTVENAATTEDLTAELKYMDRSGAEKFTKTYDVKNAVAEYAGYWPYDGTLSTKTNIPYLIGTAVGGKMAFIVSATDVDYFTGITLSIGKTNDNVDEWQMKSVAIYRVSSIPQRSGEWLPATMAADTATTDRLITRSLKITDREQYCTQKVLLNKDINSITINFDNTGGGSTEEGDVNWEEIKDSMSYYETLQDLGFNKKRYQYEINVEVRSNSSASDDYGDCGSNNKFYFQLVFENGSSGYVQANQQLTADGFRAGHVETFVISTNRDYGELKALHIIPDDMLEGNDIYDKLNVDNIEIVTIGTGGLSRSWRIENVGWIDIDYKDNGSQNTNGGQRLRSEAELTDNYMISMQGYCMNFMVAVGTGEYPTEDRVLKGTMTATIKYADSTGTQTKTIDVAEAIADYARKTTAECTTQGQDGDLGGKNRRWIDTDYMFRENHVDRFIISLSDVTEIKSIKFNVMGSEDCRWTIKSVDVYQIIEDGPLLFNANNEYQRDAKLEHLTGDTGLDSSACIEVVTTKTTSYTVNLEGNSIKVDTEQWESVIERVPSTNNDTLNLYVYLSKGKEVANPKNIKAKISFQKRDAGKDSMVTATDLTYSKEKGVLYGLGINTAKLSVLRQLALVSTDSVHVDYALIQHVRSGVVIGSYCFQFGNGDIKGQGLAMPAVPVKKTDKDSQVVSLSFGQDTFATDLIPEEQDIAVAISYTTTNDIADVLYESSYIYLTDQQIKKIGAGAAVDITFNEPYLKEIKKITIAGVGEISASIDKIMVVTYNADENGVKKISGIYGISEPLYVTRGTRTRAVSDDELALFELTFNNVQQGERNNGYASMDVFVTTTDGTDQMIHLTDLSTYTVSGDVLNGASGTIRMMMQNVAEIHYVTVQATSTLVSSPVKWYISSVNGYWMINGQETKTAQMVKSTVGDGGLSINMSDPYLNVTAKMIDEADGGAIFSRDTNTKQLNSTTNTHSNGLDMVVTKGRYLLIIPRVKDALPGASFKTELTHLSGEEHGKLTEVNGELHFELDGDLTANETYRLVITSEQCPDHILTLNIIAQIDG